MRPEHICESSPSFVMVQTIAGGRVAVERTAEMNYFLLKLHDYTMMKATNNEI